jgi:hypothetical protein
MFTRPNQHGSNILVKSLKLGSNMFNITINIISITIFIIINIIINNFEKNIITIKKPLNLI